jgi:hypothetical protein
MKNTNENLYEERKLPIQVTKELLNWIRLKNLASSKNWILRTILAKAEEDVLEDPKWWLRNVWYEFLEIYDFEEQEEIKDFIRENRKEIRDWDILVYVIFNRWKNFFPKQVLFCKQAKSDEEIKKILEETNNYFIEIYNQGFIPL